MSQASPRQTKPFLTISVVLVVACLLVWSNLPGFVGGGPSKRNRIINNLRQIDGAKQFWALQHPATGAMQLTTQDLPPYLRHLGRARSRDGFVAPVDGERYTINALDVLPEAQLSRALGNLPAGTTIRLEEDEHAKSVEPNPSVQQAGASRSTQETNQTSSATGPRR